MLEAGFFPACKLIPLDFARIILNYIPGTYIIGTWYIRGEMQKRLTGFYILAVMVNCELSPFTAWH